MWVLPFFVLVSTRIIEGMKIPIDNSSNDHLEMIPSASTSAETLQVQPIYYSSNGQGADRYLIPSGTPKVPEIHPETEIPTPATYLLPPSPDARNEYFSTPTEPGEQTDWYPIDDAPQKQNINDGHPREDKPHLRTGKILHRGQVFTVPIRNLLPPKENAPNDFIVVSPSVELELPMEEIDHTMNDPTADLNLLRIHQAEKHHFTEDNVPLRHFSLPKHYGQKHSIPTKLYPKKYVNEFKPIPIPISQYSDGSKDEIPVARPVKVIIPDDIKNGYVPRPIENNENSYENIQKSNNEAPKINTETEEASEVIPNEQDTSETNFRQPIVGPYSAPVRQTPQSPNPLKSDGKRTEFRMHGMKGPHSYQFGYDTGKGKNRQFRYEERDNDGHVRGHYGYMDRSGKLRVVNYDADPVHGFRAEAPVEKDIE